MPSTSVRTSLSLSSLSHLALPVVFVVPIFLLIIIPIFDSRPFTLTWHPTTGVEPYTTEADPWSYGTVVHPSYDTVPSFPGSRAAHLLADCHFRRDEDNGRHDERSEPKACLFGGMIEASGDYLCDLWVYNVWQHSWEWKNQTGSWNTSRTPCPGSRDLYPGGRIGYGFVRYYLGSRNADFVRLFGGRGYAVEGTTKLSYLSDVWDLNLTSFTWKYRSVGEGSETWESRADNYSSLLPFPLPGGRDTPGVWGVIDEETNEPLLYIHGGTGVSASKLNNSMTWRFDGSSGGRWEALYPEGDRVGVWSSSSCWKHDSDGVLYFYCFGRDPADGVFTPQLGRYNVILQYL